MKKQEEIRKLEAALSNAQREAREAKQKMETAAPVQNAKDSGGGSFTVEQLNTQVSVLKQRLACPVCHYRDKSCIIMRCRHMHCKECVEERITNRSRNQPKILPMDHGKKQTTLPGKQSHLHVSPSNS